MKNLNGKELMRGDVVLHATADGIVAGAIHQFYDRNDAVRIAGYPFQVPAKDTVLAQDAFNTFAVPLLKERDEAERQKLLDATKAAEVPPSVPVEPPKAPEPSQDTPPATGTA
jgi:hypothetical protein